MRNWALLASVSAMQALAQPTINSGGIVNASGYQTTLAPDTVFVIFGAGMGPAVLATANAPYPPSLDGTSVTFTPVGGGSKITAGMVYTSATQIAGFLPSSAAPGTYAVAVTFNTQTSSTQNVTVAARSMGIATANNAGTGPAQATIGTVNNGISLVRFTTGSIAFENLNWTLAPAHPGDTLVLWGTGGGADPANDTGGTSGDQTAAGNFQVIVEGTSITPLYAGASSGYPGLWQINFTVPLNISTDCFANLQVSGGGQSSNLVTIAIAPPGQNTCATSGFSNSAISNLASGKNIVDAIVSVSHIVNSVNGQQTITDQVGARFDSDTPGAFLPPFEGPVVGGCRIFQESFPVGGLPPTTASAYLDAGTVTVNGPGLSSVKLGLVPNSANGPQGKYYLSTVAPGTVALGGTYTISATGGADIEPFTVAQTMPPAFTVTNLAGLSILNRAQPTTVNWTGGGTGTVQVVIQTLKSTATTNFEVFVSCTAPATAGTLTIPTAALAYLPAIGASDFAYLNVAAGETLTAALTGVNSAEQDFLPGLTAGGTADFGQFAAVIAFGQQILIN